MDDPSRLRISDAERHQVAEILRQAAGEGRLDFEELDERLEATYAAKTYADLVPITLDLPTQGGLVARPAAAPTPVPQPVPHAGPLVVPGQGSTTHLAIMSSLDRRGYWVVPRQMNVLALMGGAHLDLRAARFAAQHVTLNVTALMGGADIIVPPHVHVVMDGIGIMGGYAGPSGKVPEELTPDSPTVRIRGVAIWGGVNVVRKGRKPDVGPSGPGAHQLGH